MLDRLQNAGRWLWHNLFPFLKVPEEHIVAFYVPDALSTDLFMSLSLLAAGKPGGSANLPFESGGSLMLIKSLEEDAQHSDCLVVLIPRELRRESYTELITDDTAAIVFHTNAQMSSAWTQYFLDDYVSNGHLQRETPVLLYGDDGPLLEDTKERLLRSGCNLISDPVGSPEAAVDAILATLRTPQ